MRGIIIVFLIFAVTGCKSELSTDVYLEDVRAVGVNGKNVPDVHSKLTIEFPSLQSCQREIDRVLRLMDAAFRNPRDPVCREVGNAAMLAVTFDIPFYDRGDPKMPADTAIAIGIGLIEEQQVIAITPNLNREKVDGLRTAIRREYMQEFGVEAVRLHLALRNKSSEPATVRIFSSFVNGIPVPHTVNFAVEPGGVLNVQVSKVALALLFKQDGLSVAWLNL